MIRDLIAHRDLLWLLVVREIRIRYARAALGAAWAVFVPVAMMLVFTVLNFGRLMEIDGPLKGIEYPLFAFCGLLPWTHFSTSLTQGTPSLVRAADLLKKSRFPHEVIPLSRTFAALLDLLVGLLVLGGMMAYYGIVPGPSALAVPAVFALQLMFTTGLVLLLAAANLFFRDVNYLVQVGVVLAMFATSVVYPLPEGGELVTSVLAANPMSAYLDAYREALLAGIWPSWELLKPGVIGAVLSLVVGVVVFNACRWRFAEEV